MSRRPSTLWPHTQTFDNIPITPPTTMTLAKQSHETAVCRTCNTHIPIRPGTAGPLTTCMSQGWLTTSCVQRKIVTSNSLQNDHVQKRLHKHKTSLDEFPFCYTWGVAVIVMQHTDGTWWHPTAAPKFVNKHVTLQDARITSIAARDAAVAPSAVLIRLDDLASLVLAVVVDADGSPLSTIYISESLLCLCKDMSVYATFNTVATYVRAARPPSHSPTPRRAAMVVAAAAAALPRRRSRGGVSQPARMKRVLGDGDDDDCGSTKSSVHSIATTAVSVVVRTGPRPLKKAKTLRH